MVIFIVKNTERYNMIPRNYSEVVQNLRRHRFSFMTRTKCSENTTIDIWFGGDGGLDSFVFTVGPSDNILHLYCPICTTSTNELFNRHDLEWYMGNFDKSSLDIPLIPVNELFPIQENGEYVRNHPTIVGGREYRSPSYTEESAVKELILD